MDVAKQESALNIHKKVFTCVKRKKRMDKY